MKTNEINAITAFIEILRKIKGVEYKIGSFPEKENRNTQDVEVILVPKDKDVQSPKIAVEHTIVEAHEDQIAYVNQSYDLVMKINQKCQGKLPTNYHFQLVIPPALIVDTSNKSRDQFVEGISNWVLDIAETLNANQWSSQLYNGHKVSLGCDKSISELNGKIGRYTTGPKEADKERQDRFRRAIEEKLPKLIKYKEKGCSTALLLEDISGRHSNSGDNLKELIPDKYHSEFQSKIDYVVIFVSFEEEMIVGKVWKEGSQLYEEIPYNRRFSFRQ
ncbi:MAG: hypothetical protein ABSH16_07080 [Sedimentisphaerales bacterium]